MKELGEKDGRSEAGTTAGELLSLVSEVMYGAPNSHRLLRVPHRDATQVVREILPSGLALRINIDATLVGNVARFFNHR